MNKTFFRHISILAVFSLVSIFSANAANVSVMIIESGFDQESSSSSVNLPHLAGIWESGMMDILFEAGHIVSNAESMTITRNAEEDIPEEVRSSIDAAILGGADYFIMVFLHYEPLSDSHHDARPVQVMLELLSLRPSTVLFKEKIAKPNKTNQRDEFANAQKAARIVIPYIGKGKV
jgi:hypothetical protein